MAENSDYKHYEINSVNKVYIYTHISLTIYMYI